jgi:hypothetical protein
LQEISHLYGVYAKDVNTVVLSILTKETQKITLVSFYVSIVTAQLTRKKLNVLPVLNVKHTI